MYPVLGSQEAHAMLFAYLPGQKMLIEADMFTPKAPDAAEEPTASTRSLE